MKYCCNLLLNLLLLGSLQIARVFCLRLWYNAVECL